MKEPTHDECSVHTEIEVDGRRGFAAWYPQMGGYTSHCIIVPDPTNTCFDVLIWHDGDFPFGDDKPRKIHHCDPAQFVDFGHLCEELSKK